MLIFKSQNHLTTSNNYDILLGDGRSTDFLSKRWTQSRLEEFNRSSVISPNASFLFGDKMKKCIKCKQLKDENEFHFGRIYKGKIYKINTCKECCKNYHYIRYRSKKKEIAIYSKLRYQKLPKQIKDRYYQNNLLRREQYRRAWISFWSQNPKCEICNKSLQYFSGNKSTTVYFDHKIEREYSPIKVIPNCWLLSHYPTEENRKFWDDCKFGKLCSVCNRNLITKNREEWIKNAYQYVFGESR